MSKRKPIPIAHRGSFDVAPENTLEAFEEAYRIGMGGVEIDIRQSKDGEIIVFHDETAERLTLGMEQEYRLVPINELTREEIKSLKLPFAGHMLTYFPKEGFENEIQYYLPWDVVPHQEIRTWMNSYEDLDSFVQFLRDHNEYYREAIQKDERNTQIVTLEEFFCWLKKTESFFFAEIEFKEKGLIDGVVCLIEKYQLFDRCILFSGVQDINDEIQDYVEKNDLREVLLVGENHRFLKEDSFDYIKQRKLYEVGLNAGHYTKQDVERLHQMGVKVFSNLGDYPNWWKEINENGTDAFKTNTGKRYILSWGQN